MFRSKERKVTDLVEVEYEVEFAYVFEERVCRGDKKSEFRHEFWSKIDDTNLRLRRRDGWPRGMRARYRSRRRRRRRKLGAVTVNNDQISGTIKEME